MDGSETRKCALDPLLAKLYEAGKTIRNQGPQMLQAGR
jgi:hypothetical protein